jgi:hypothetical protein
MKPCVPCPLCGCLPTIQSESSPTSYNSNQAIAYIKCSTPKCKYGVHHQSKRWSEGSTQATVISLWNRGVVRYLKDRIVEDALSSCPLSVWCQKLKLVLNEVSHES